MQLITDAGFVPAARHVLPDEGVIELANDADPATLVAEFDRIALISIPFPNSGDGRGFSLARRLRNLGYAGRLRATGHVISDQYRYARACGFDEVEVADNLAERQPEQHWRDGGNDRLTYRDKLAGRRNASEPLIPDGVYAERVTEVAHYTGSLFRFRITRPAALRFNSGQFVMIGLPNGEKPVFRAYSIASPSWDEELDFYSIKVPDGPLTKHLQRIIPGDTILLRKKPTGTLVLDSLRPGRRLYLFSTGTGIAPFASLIRDPETYEKFGEVILTHTCRTHAELAYGKDVVAAAKSDPLVGELVRENLQYYASTTREAGPRHGRITTLIESGQLFSDLGLPPMDPAEDRAMICGSLAMVKDTQALLERAGFSEGATNRPAEVVVERAFVD